MSHYLGHMNSNELHVAVLQALLELAAADRQPSVRRLAERVGARLGAVAQALSVLHEAGLVDATRLRLTLSGLAVAVASRSLTRPVALAA